MRNLKVTISYNGAQYYGYQRQETLPSIQQAVEQAIKQLLYENITINGCSRTDAGVHAREYVFNFRTDNKIPCSGFIKGMNAILSEDIAVLSCTEADDDFHARFCCKGKEYLYKIHCSEIKDVFQKKLAMNYPFKLDTEKMQAAAKLLVGEHDFAAFCTAEAKQRLESTVRTVYDISVKRDGEYVCIYVSGNGFLHNMVRIIVGTLIYVSEGKRTEQDILNALKTGNRELAGKTVIPDGLYLNKVYYL